MGKKVVARRQVPVQDFDSGKTSFKPIEIVGRAASGESRKDVVQAEEQTLFPEIGHQPGKIVSPALNLGVLALVEVVNADVKFVAAGRPAGDLFTQEKILVPPQALCRINGIVVGNGDQIQPLALELLVEGFGRVVAFAAKTVQHRQGGHAGVDGVHVQVTFHIPGYISYVTDVSLADEVWVKGTR